MKKRIMGVWLVFLAALILTACKSASSGAGAEKMEMEAETAADSPGTDGGLSLPQVSAVQDAGQGVLQAENGEQSKDPSPSRKRIRTVTLHIEAEDFDGILRHIGERTEALGGYTEQSETGGKQADSRGEPIPRYASMTVRIPCDRLNEFIAEAERQGNVVSRSENTQDITLQYSDIESRKKTLEMEQERIWALLEEADTLDGVIALEKRLSEIRYELESMESRLRLYDNQIEYSIVHLYISEAKSYSPDNPQSIGQRIGTGFKKSTHTAAAFVSDLFVGIIVFIPYWGPPVLLLFVFRCLGRKYAKKNQDKK